MQTKKLNLQSIKGKLSRAEMKNIMAGSGDDGCGTGISCAEKKSGDSCGTNQCTCEYTGGTLYCNKQL